jgi:hypothetical protein
MLNFQMCLPFIPVFYYFYFCNNYIMPIAVTEGSLTAIALASRFQSSWRHGWMFAVLFRADRDFAMG